MSTLKDNAMSFIGELTQGVTNTLKDSVLPTVNGWLEELQSAFTSNGVEAVSYTHLDVYKRQKLRLIKSGAAIC